MTKLSRFALVALAFVCASAHANYMRIPPKASPQELTELAVKTCQAENELMFTVSREQPTALAFERKKAELVKRDEWMVEGVMSWTMASTGKKSALPVKCSVVRRGDTLQLSGGVNG